MDEARRAFGAQEPRRDWTVALGLLLVIGGAIGVAAACIALPLVRTSQTYVEIEGNRAILFEVGWYVLAGAVAAPSLAIGRWRGVDVPWWIVSMLGACGVVVAAGLALDVSQWSIYDFDLRGPDQVGDDSVSAASGVWLIGLGAVVVAVGGRLLARIPSPPKPQAARLPAAGWYHDPDDREQLRWWDGARWGETRRPLPPPLERWARPQAPGTAAAAAAGDALWRRPENDPPAGG